MRCLWRRCRMQPGSAAGSLSEGSSNCDGLGNSFGAGALLCARTHTHTHTHTYTYIHTYTHAASHFTPMTMKHMAHNMVHAQQPEEGGHLSKVSCHVTVSPRNRRTVLSVRLCMCASRAASLRYRGPTQSSPAVSDTTAASTVNALYIQSLHLCLAPRLWAQNIPHATVPPGHSAAARMYPSSCRRRSQHGAVPAEAAAGVASR